MIAVNISKLYLANFDKVSDFNSTIPWITGYWFLVSAYIGNIICIVQKNKHLFYISLSMFFCSSILFWILYFLGCRKILTMIKEPRTLLCEILFRSSIVAIAAWAILFLKLVLPYKGNIQVDFPVFLISDTAVLYYLLLDMFKYTRNKIDEFEKQKKKEELNSIKYGGKNFSV